LNIKILTPLEPSWRHLPETFSHTSLQKVRGYIDGFTGLRTGPITVPKILLISWEVKGKIAFENTPVSRQNLTIGI